MRNMGSKRVHSGSDEVSVSFTVCGSQRVQPGSGRVIESSQGPGVRGSNQGLGQPVVHSGSGVRVWRS